MMAVGRERAIEDAIMEKKIDNLLECFLEDDDVKILVVSGVMSAVISH
jgi:hypothetical protein